MLAELIDRLVALGRDTEQLEIVEHEKIPGLVHVRHGSKLEVLDVPPPARTPELCGLPDVVRALKDPAIASQPEVYFDETGIRVLLDRDKRTEVLTMPLRVSERFQFLQDLKPRTLSVSQVVKLLRFDLHGTGVETVIAKVRRVDFHRRSDGTNDVGHGRESLGRSVEAVVQQADDVPEQFKITVPVYSNPGVRQFQTEVRIGIYLDMDAEGIELRVLADELELARDFVLAKLAHALEESLPDVPILHGKP